jgi:hypothetical protein
MLQISLAVLPSLKQTLIHCSLKSVISGGQDGTTDSTPYNLTYQCIIYETPHGFEINGK